MSPGVHEFPIHYSKVFESNKTYKSYWYVGESTIYPQKHSFGGTVIAVRQVYTRSIPFMESLHYTSNRFNGRFLDYNI